MANNWAVQRQAAMAQTTTHDILAGFIAQGWNQKRIAAELGITGGAASMLLRRHGLRCGIVYQGIRDSVAGHCRRLGLCTSAVWRTKSVFRLTDAEALDVELGKRRRK